MGFAGRFLLVGGGGEGPGHRGLTGILAWLAGQAGRASQRAPVVIGSVASLACESLCPSVGWSVG